MKLFTFNSLDILGEPISFSFAGKSTHKTTIGSFLTLIYISVLLSALVKVSQDYLDTTKPGIIQTKGEAYSAPKIDLYSNKIVHSFFIFNIHGQPVPTKDWPRYVTPVARHLRLEFSPDDLTFTPIGLELTEIPIVACSSLSSQEISELYDYFEVDQKGYRFVMEYGICLKPPKDKYYSQGKALDSVLAYPEILFYPCQSQNNDCIPEAELNGAGLYTQLPKFGLDLSNKVRPIKTVPNTLAPFIINPRSRYNHNYNLRMNHILDNSGFLTPQTLTKEYADVQEVELIPGQRSNSITQCLPQDFDHISCPTYLHLKIQSTGSSITIERTYQGVVESLGELGGIKEILLIAIVFLYKIMSSKSQTDNMASQVYRTDAKMREYVECISNKHITTMSKKEIKKMEEVLKKTSQKKVESNLDIINIMKCMDKVELMWNGLFSQDLRSVEQIAALCMGLKSRNEKNKKKNSSFSSKGPGTQLDEFTISVPTMRSILNNFNGAERAASLINEGSSPVKFNRIKPTGNRPIMNVGVSSPKKKFKVTPSVLNRKNDSLNRKNPPEEFQSQLQEEDMEIGRLENSERNKYRREQTHNSNNNLLQQQIEILILESVKNCIQEFRITENDGWEDRPIDNQSGKL